MQNDGTALYGDSSMRLLPSRPTMSARQSSLRHGPSQDFDRVGGHPDVDLAERCPHLFLEFDEELSAFRQVWGIHERTDEIVAEELVLVAPQAADRLRFAGDSAEALF